MSCMKGGVSNPALQLRTHAQRAAQPLDGSVIAVISDALPASCTLFNAARPRVVSSHGGHTVPTRPHKHSSPEVVRLGALLVGAFLWRYHGI